MLPNGGNSFTGKARAKENKGIFPASVDFTTDLHSMGQYIQEGRRNLFETVLSIDKTKYSLQVPCDAHDLDKLNYLAGKRVDEVNKMAELGTQLAHVDGGVPNIRVVIPELTEYYLGQLFYFYELACGISGGILGVNTFDQPGVEAYKNNMFMLLGKPGYAEKIKSELAMPVHFLFKQGFLPSFLLPDGKSEVRVIQYINSQ